MTTVTTVCVHCGATATGRFCSACGHALERETLQRDLSSRIKSPLVTALACTKTAWLVLRRPTMFYRSLATGIPPLNALPSPLAGVWRRLTTDPQQVLRPFQALTAGIAAMVIAAAVNVWAWDASGVGTALTGLTSAELQTSAETLASEAYQQAYGEQLRILRRDALTGVALIDEVLSEVLSLLEYLWLPLIVLLLLRSRRIDRHLLLHFYVYAVAASLAVYVACNLASVAAVMALSGVSPALAIGAGAGPEAVGYLARIYCLVLLPIIVFPRVLPLPRARIVVATAVGVVIWMIGNAVLTGFLALLFGVVWT